MPQLCLPALSLRLFEIHKMKNWDEYNYQREDNVCLIFKMPYKLLVAKTPKKD
jgi:hypothetical protein